MAFKKIDRRLERAPRQRQDGGGVMRLQFENIGGEGEDRIARKMEGVATLLADLINAMGSLPPPKVDNRVDVAPTPVDVKVEPKIKVDAVVAQQKNRYVFDIERDRQGRIERIIATPTDSATRRDGDLKYT